MITNYQCPICFKVCRIYNIPSDPGARADINELLEKFKEDHVCLKKRY